MRKKTVPCATKRQRDSSSKQKGLIAKEKNTQQSAMTESVLDNLSHRTTLQISCERIPGQLTDVRVPSDVTMRTNKLTPPAFDSFICVLGCTTSPARVSSPVLVP
jgi:hypothetical protein